MKTWQVRVLALLTVIFGAALTWVAFDIVQFAPRITVTVTAFVGWAIIIAGVYTFSSGERPWQTYA